MSARRANVMAPEVRYCLSKTEAAAYIGLSVPTFEALLRKGLMPAPKVAEGRRIWVKSQVELAALNLPEDALVQVADIEDAEAARWAM